MNKVEITLPMVKKLVTVQFSQYADLPIKPVALSGVDNRVFHLGDDMLVRLPSASRYVAQVEKEQQWLPILASGLSIPIPEPLAEGQPNDEYPWRWSIYRWLEGQSANLIAINDVELKQIAIDLADFLLELQGIDIARAPGPGKHNCYRGDHPSVYDADIKKLFLDLQADTIDKNGALEVWQKAMASSWSHNPVWVHGDVASGNFLVKEGRLSAVIDFGSMGVGDPSCDLVIAWTFFNKESRKIFYERIDLDPDTWARARGWALWKACFLLAGYKNKQGGDALVQKQLIQEIIDDHEACLGIL